VRALPTVLCVAIAFQVGCGFKLPDKRDDQPDLVPTPVERALPPASPAVEPPPTAAVPGEGEPGDVGPDEEPGSEGPPGDAAAEVIRRRIAWKRTHAPVDRTPTATPLPIFQREFVAAGIAESPDLGLMWTTRAAGGFSPEDAAAYCEVLELGGYDDWRLPPVDELVGVLYAEAGRSWGADVRELWSSTPHDPRGFETVGVPEIFRSNRVVGMAHAVCTRSVAPAGGS